MTFCGNFLYLLQVVFDCALSAVLAIARLVAPEMGEASDSSTTER